MDTATAEGKMVTFTPRELPYTPLSVLDSLRRFVGSDVEVELEGYLAPDSFTGRVRVVEGCLVAVDEYNLTDLVRGGLSSPYSRITVRPLHAGH